MKVFGALLALPLLVAAIPPSGTYWFVKYAKFLQSTTLDHPVTSTHEGPAPRQATWRLTLLSTNNATHTATATIENAYVKGQYLGFEGPLTKNTQVTLSFKKHVWTLYDDTRNPTRIILGDAHSNLVFAETNGNIHPPGEGKLEWVPRPTTSYEDVYWGSVKRAVN